MIANMFEGHSLTHSLDLSGNLSALFCPGMLCQFFIACTWFLILDFIFLEIILICNFPTIFE